MNPRYLGLRALRLSLKTRTGVLFVTEHDRARGILGKQL